MEDGPSFDELPYERPDPAALAAEADALCSAWAGAGDADAELALISRWDAGQRRFATQSNLASVRFWQDTRDPAFKAEKRFFDQLQPDVKAATLRFLAGVVGSARRPALEAALGPQALAGWEVELQTFDPRIAEDKRAESELENQYDERMGGLMVEFRGERLTRSALAARFGDADRGTRRAARQAQDALLGGPQAELDRLFGGLVDVRHRMATALGYPDFVGLGYARLGRTDYGPGDVAAFRAQIREVIVPLCDRIYARRRAALGVEPLFFHDESVRDSRGVPRPLGDHDWMMARADEMFAALGDDFLGFFRMMRRRGLLDLGAREGKVGGGFATSLSSFGVPFIFGNFNGTRDDVMVFTHEMGHAFQWYQAREQPLSTYEWPTYESSEIPSMGLELLTFPHMDRFFGDEADRYRVGHLEDSVLFLPYGAAVDEFQHRIYAEPGLDADARAAVWREIEGIYLPHREYDDMAYFEGGRVWQRQNHIYLDPFYYIDYCLAQTVAWQIWRRSRADFEGTMKRYRQLCALGGSLPFRGLLGAVGLDDPFAPGCLEGVVGTVAAELGL